MPSTPRWRSCAAALALLLATALPLRADDGQPAEGSGAAAEIPAQVFDLLILRPSGALATGLGFGAFLVALPFTAATIGYEQPWNVFVAGPAEYTFVRPLGDF